MCIRDRLKRLAQACQSELADQLVLADKIVTTEKISLRYHGTDLSLSVPFANVVAMKEDFERRHFDRFGFVMNDKNLVVESISVDAEAKSPSPKMASVADHISRSKLPKCNVYVENQWQQIDLWTSEEISLSSQIHGPALIVDRISTTIIERGWRATLDTSGALVITRVGAIESSNQAQDLSLIHI